METPNNANLISLEEANELWNDGAAVFLDARGPDDFAAGHIADAFNLPALDFEKYFARELDSLADLESDRLIERTPDGFSVTEVGRLLIRNIAMRFDVYLPAEKERRFSKTI